MTVLEVFDPAMCCSTGVCGPTVDPKLAIFEADLRFAASQGAQVTRYNLGSEPGAFAGSDIVRSILQTAGEDVLPVVLVDGKLKWTGHYPSRDELLALLPTTVAADGCCPPAEAAAGCCPPTPATVAAQVIETESAAAGCAPNSGCC